MKTATINISRSIGTFNEKKDPLRFREGDFYNIYHHLVADASYEGSNSYTTKFFAFKVTSISEKAVDIEKICPPVGNITLSVGECADLDFGQYGTYSLTLEKISEI
jgi:hypothetical protein